MNDFHLLNLANTTISERRAEADRYRLARSATTTRNGVGAISGDAPQAPSRPRFGRSSFLGRLALR